VNGGRFVRVTWQSNVALSEKEVKESKGKCQWGAWANSAMRAMPAQTKGAERMPTEPRKVITLEVNAEGVPQELMVDGESFSISEDQKRQGEELLTAFSKAAGMVLALQNQPAARGKG
jgi:hypothetical protein